MTRSLETEGFTRSLLFEDSVDDWALARDLGEFQVLVGPELLVGHLQTAEIPPPTGACLAAVAGKLT